MPLCLTQMPISRALKHPAPKAHECDARYGQNCSRTPTTVAVAATAVAAAIGLGTPGYRPASIFRFPNPCMRPTRLVDAGQTHPAQYVPATPSVKAISRNMRAALGVDAAHRCAPDACAAQGPLTCPGTWTEQRVGGLKAGTPPASLKLFQRDHRGHDAATFLSLSLALRSEMRRFASPSRDSPMP
jgi:hypothetical protein